MIPLSVPWIQGNEWKYIKSCLDTEWVSSAGKYVKKFESEIARFTGAKYAVACVNGTSALHISLIVVGVKPGDEVIVPTITFIAPVNVVKYVGAEPVFMDCDEYYNIDAQKIIEFIKKYTVYKNGCSYNKKTKRKISAIIPVHVFGNAAKLEDVAFICKKHGIIMLEDASESLGTFYSKDGLKGKHTGRIGDIGCFSFNGNKIITTGGGGMIITNNKKYAEKANYLTTQAKNDEVRYVHNEIGYNYRLTNLQAAMGVAQLEQLPKYLEIKKNNYQTYKKAIDKIPGLHLAEIPDYARNNYWMYCLQIDKKLYGKDKEQLMKHLAEHEIQTRPAWCPNHLQKPYKNCQGYKIENALKLFDITLNLPCSTNLSKAQIQEVINALKD